MKKKYQSDFDFFTAPVNPGPSKSPAVPPPAAVPLDIIPPAQQPQSPPFTLPRMRLAVLSWLYDRKPTGLALAVPTRFRKYQADVAAFWSLPARRRPRPGMTAIVEIRLGRDHCWPDCSGKEELLKRLRELKIAKEKIEASIRATEPRLRDADTLFDEYQSWNYLGSANPDYQPCLRSIEKAEHALYNGSRFEQIRRALLAEYTYLAVPEGTVTPDEIAYGWGLLHVTADLRILTIKEAVRWECPEENKFHLVHNIAAASLKDVLFANGVNVQNDGRKILTSPPRRRRKTVDTHEISE